MTDKQDKKSGISDLTGAFFDGLASEVTPPDFIKRQSLLEMIRAGYPLMVAQNFIDPAPEKAAYCVKSPAPGRH